MALFESIFDLAYLIGVVALGLRLLLQKDPAAKLFGSMAVLLGSGDAFHLLPRIISYWSEGGFAAHAAALSWGECVTSVTMTLFYLLYYFYYKKQSGDRSKIKDYLVYALVVLRIGLSLMPQNGWGEMPGNYLWALLRNIPFALLGLLLIIWSWQQRNAKGMAYMAVLIALSFLFYAPVVVGARFFPWLGAFMLPKTVAYFVLVVVGYKNFVPAFSSRSLLELAFVNLILGLSGGVFFREFTKAYAFTLPTYLGKVHAHVLSLGFLGLLILYLLLLFSEGHSKGTEQTLSSKLRKPVLLWNAGLGLTVLFFLLHGIIEVLGSHYGTIPPAAIAGLAGLGHIILAAGLIWTLLIFLNVKNTNTPGKKNVRGD